MRVLRFNPRPRAAGDIRLSNPDPVLDVSIHARARRATEPVTAPSILTSFNPRPRAAGDEFEAVALRLITRFNPRPRAAGDLDFKLEY